MSKLKNLWDKIQQFWKWIASASAKASIKEKAEKKEAKNGGEKK